MNRDLEAQLEEMGGEYRAVVDRLVGAYQPMKVRLPGAANPDETRRPARVLGWTVGYLAAASLLVLFGVGAVVRHMRPSAPAHIYTVRATDAATEYSLAYIRNDEAVKEMIRTQNADGSWKNDFLTRQNAAALKRCALPEAHVAYKKAMRNLRVRGVL